MSALPSDAADERLAMIAYCLCLLPLLGAALGPAMAKHRPCEAAAMHAHETGRPRAA